MFLAPRLCFMQRICLAQGNGSRPHLTALSGHEGCANFPADGAPRMILTCPSCSTRYQADSALFVPPGRNVRCAKCGHVWFQTAPESEPEPEAAIPPPPEPVPAMPPPAAAPTLAEVANRAPEEAAQPRLRRRPQRGSVLADAIAWAALILLAVTIGWAAVQYRQTIV